MFTVMSKARSDSQMLSQAQAIAIKCEYDKQYDDDIVQHSASRQDV